MASTDDFKEFYRASYGRPGHGSGTRRQQTTSANGNAELRDAATGTVVKVLHPLGTRARPAYATEAVARLRPAITRLRYARDHELSTPS